MNNIKFVAVRAAISLLLVGVFVKILSANEDKSLSTIDKEVLKERIETLYSPVDLRYTSEVHQIVDTYIRGYRRGSEKLLGLSEKFFPIYEEELGKMGLPGELKYLSVVESDLRPTVVSRAGAVGLWQFMKATSQSYGLTTNDVVDERRDPIRSTQAASAYLKDLYLQFGDWTLALAAYNCGPGKVKRALSKSNKDEYWDLKSYLPRETRKYIPKYVAISYMMSYSYAHGLNPILDYDLNTLATVRIFDYTSLKQVAEIAGLDTEKVKQLNPAFLKNYIPKSPKGYLLTLPELNMYNFLAQVGGWEHMMQTGRLSKSLQEQYYRYGAMKRQLEVIQALEKLPFKLDIKLDPNSFGENRAKPVTPSSIEGSKIQKLSRLPNDERYDKIIPVPSATEVTRLKGDDLKSRIQGLIDKSIILPPGWRIRI